MNIIDLTLFEYETLPIKCKSKTYIITTIPANIELELLHIQASSPELVSSGFKNLTDEILNKWKKLVRDLICLNNLELLDSDIDDLSPLQMITLITALNRVIDKRAGMMGQILNSKKK